MATSLEHTAELNRVRWDKLPEALRQFLRGLASSPDGTVIEDDGRPMFRVLPYPRPAGGQSGLDWTPQDNQRRCDLLDRDLDGALTPVEQSELVALEQRLDRHVDAIAPLPLEPLRLLHQKLLAKSNGTSTP